jgi:hypothetical protein
VSRDSLKADLRDADLRETILQASSCLTAYTVKEKTEVDLSRGKPLSTGLSTDVGDGRSAIVAGAEFA